MRSRARAVFWFGGAKEAGFLGLVAFSWMVGVKVFKALSVLANGSHCYPLSP